MKFAEKLAKQADENARFAALPDAQRRVAIAKDVLRWLAIGKLAAKHQAYLQLPRGTDDEGYINGYSCSACALGSLFAVAAERDLTADRATDTVNGWDIAEQLSPHFSEQQLGLIEIAFEHGGNGRAPGSAYVRASGSPRAQISAAELFNRGIRGARARMERIMKNIIANRGEFKP